MTKVLDWKKSEDVRDVVHLSVQALAEGHVVALPTCTSYVAAALATDLNAIDTLYQIATSQISPGNNGSARKTLLPYGALVMRHAKEVVDFCPPLVRRRSDWQSEYGLVQRTFLLQASTATR